MTALSYENSMNQALIRLQFELFVPLFPHNFSGLRFLDFSEFFFALHVGFCFFGHLLTDFKILKFLNLFLYCVVFYLLKNVRLNIFFVVVHTGSLLSWKSNFTTRHLTFNIFFSIKIKQFLVFKHLFKESWLHASRILNFFLLDLFGPIPLNLLVPILFIGLESLLLLDSLEQLFLGKSFNLFFELYSF